MGKCRATGCQKNATYGVAKGKPLVCKPHKERSFVDVYHQMCREAGCSKRPSFGVVANQPHTCKAHKEEHFFCVVRKTCASTGCNIGPGFALPGKPSKHCAQHKMPGEIGVYKPCVEDGCTKNPSFGFPGGKRTHCYPHSLDGQIHVGKPSCASDGCGKTPSFGFEDGEITHCASHKLDEHVALRYSICQEPGCTITASFGPGGEGQVWCATHRRYGDVNRFQRQCKEVGCTTGAGFGMEMGQPLSCRRHGREGYKCVVGRRCETEMCSVYTVIDRSVVKHRHLGVGMCGPCFRQMYPDLNKLKVLQEHFVLSEIQRRIPRLEQYFMVHDCPLPCAISMERPDMLWMVGETLLHVEIDETPTHEDNRDRLMRILAGTDAVEHVVIRIHTHEYSDGTEQRLSCFRPRRLKNGEKAIAANKEEFNRRMDIVVKTVDDLLVKNESGVNILFVDT